MKRCLNCMKTYEDSGHICPYCGYEESTPPRVEFHLHPGTLIGNRYIIGVMLGHGGFGVTYKAWDIKLEIVVAIKEFFPVRLVNRIPGSQEVMLQEMGRERLYYHEKQNFLQETKTLAKFNSHPNIVHVTDYFEANNTAYMVMEYLDGIDLLPYVRQTPGNKVALDELLPIVNSICEALKEVHKAGIVHRDIAPDNIRITMDGKVKLYDFGAARETLSEDGRETTIVVKPGYAPPEQYLRKSKLGPWTDVYALCATMYHLLTGVRPEESRDRLMEECLIPPRDLNPLLPVWMEQVLLRGMALEPKNRFRDIEQLQSAITNQKEVAQPNQIIKRKSYIRRIAFLGAVCLCIIGTLILVTREEGLTDEDIPDGTIMVCLPDTEYNKKAYSKAKKQFESKFPGKTIKLNYVEDETEFEGMDVIFASDQSENLQREAADITYIYENIDKKDYRFIKDYEDRLIEKRIIPLGIDVYLFFYNKYLVKKEEVLRNDITNISAIEVNRLKKSIKSKSKFFVSEIDYGKDVKTTDDCVKLFSSEKSATLIAQSKNLPAIQNTLAGYYEILPLSFDGNYIGRFSNCFFVNDDCTDTEKAIASLWLRYLLSNEGQNILFIENAASVPLSRGAFDEYLNIYSKLRMLDDMTANMKILN